MPSRSIPLKLPENMAATVKWQTPGALRPGGPLSWSAGSATCENLRSASARGHAQEQEGASDITIWPDSGPCMTLAELDANLAM
jgi:hypothetical protein